MLNTYSTSLEAVVLYLLGYMALVCLLGILLWLLSLSLPAADLHPAAYLGTAGGAAVSFVYLLLLVSLAGLPPMFFFFCKVTLLSTILTAGLWGFSLVVLACLALGWLGYAKLLFAYLSLSEGNPAGTQQDYALSGFFSFILAALSLFVLLGFLGFLDLSLLATWFVS